MDYNKLVRDRIPEIIRKKGENPKTHIATDNEYWESLKNKLREEVEEFVKSESKEELADISEVLKAIMRYTKFEEKELEEIRTKKAGERGAFDSRIILESTD